MPSSARAPHEFHPFPTRRSSDLKAGSSHRLYPCKPHSPGACLAVVEATPPARASSPIAGISTEMSTTSAPSEHRPFPTSRATSRTDRKSTRLNSSHVSTSYAVFCSRPTRVPPFPYTTLFRSEGWKLTSIVSMQTALPWGVLGSRGSDPSGTGEFADRWNFYGNVDDFSALGTQTVPYFAGNVKNRSEEHTSELQSRFDLVCRLLLAPHTSSTLSLHDALPI